MSSGIGGFLGFEGFSSPGFHDRAIAFNSSRNAFKALLKGMESFHGRLPSHIHLPVLNCPDVAEMVSAAFPEVTLLYYNVDENLRPICSSFDEAGEGLFYIVNHFGLVPAVGTSLNSATVVDNVHAFFRAPIGDCHTLYSARKFFAVPDGGYLYTKLPLSQPEPWISWFRCVHLLKRADLGPDQAYADFIKAEHDLSKADVAGMSRLSEALIASVDMELCRAVRLANFSQLHLAFKEFNELGGLIERGLNDSEFVPFTYPLLCENAGYIRDRLVKMKIYTPVYWKAVLSDVRANEFERHLSFNTLHLPIDQRYSSYEMQLVIEAVHSIIG